MTDVRDADAPATANENQANPQRRFHLVRADDPGSGSIESLLRRRGRLEYRRGASPSINGYRMIGRSDGGFAGGVLPLTDEMQQHGARPIWLGYICVDDVDQAVASDRTGRRQGADARVRHSQCRPDRDGRRSAGRPLLRDEADPARGTARRRRATSFHPTSSSAFAGTSCPPAIPPPPANSTRTSLAGARTSSWIWARWANIASSSRTATGSARCAAPCRAGQPKWRYYIRVPSIAAAEARPRAGGGTYPHGSAPGPGRRLHRHRQRPAGRRVRPRRRAAK